MRTYSLLSAILTIVALSFVASAEPIPPRKLVASNPRVGQVERDVNNNRVGVAFGRPPSGQVYNDQKRREWKEVGGTKRTSNGESAGGGGGGSADGAANYLITLERSATNDVKDKILDLLLRSGAVVKQTYDYRVFKGILFTIPQNDDKGLTSWQASLGKQEGVKYVEEDSIVKIQ